MEKTCKNCKYLNNLAKETEEAVSSDEECFLIKDFNMRWFQNNKNQNHINKTN